jgi:hypothetical protein
MATSVIERPAWPFVVSSIACVTSALAGALTLFVPDVLRGPAVMNGSGRGTAAVVLFVAVPVLGVSMFEASRGSSRATITWLGSAAYLVYNAFMFLFMSPFNSLFLVYIAMFAACVWTLVVVLSGIDVESFGKHFRPTLPAHAIALFLAAIGGLNALAWLVQVAPAVFSSATPKFLAGTGLITPAGWIQDLAFWIPLMLVASVWMWRRRPWGVVLVGALLVFGVIEGLGIATDQWMGHAADPSSTVASAVMTPIFATFALVQLIPLYFYFRNLNRR